jgi:hypothetical protein
MVTTDGAGASHGLITRLDKLASRRGYQVIYSVGWELGERERAAIRLVPPTGTRSAPGKIAESAGSPRTTSLSTPVG